MWRAALLNGTRKTHLELNNKPLPTHTKGSNLLLSSLYRRKLPTVNYTLSQGPAALPRGRSHPLRRTPQFLHPSSSGKNPRSTGGGVVSTSPRAPPGASFPPAPRLPEPRSCVCTPERAPPPTLGRRRFPGAEPPPGRRVSAKDRAEEVRGRRLCPAGGRTRARAGRRARPRRASQRTPWARGESDAARPGRVLDGEGEALPGRGRVARNESPGPFPARCAWSPALRGRPGTARGLRGPGETRCFGNANPRGAARCPELGGVRSAEPRPLRAQSDSPVETLASAPGSRGRGLRWKAAGTHDSCVGTQ
ncbi:unnamed protein product [Nyctereutes procyonoides]|uniref:(raccoon dog) hypothetical protein n=1 Tax=Nyctereutes procyonoides TaxID=34880 RepID=A0A811ZGF9_NYCPR|nr:unnamed protein product [Nyctereutes procyonoides]